MVIPTSFSRPISSFNAISSPSFCFLKPNFVCPNNAVSSSNYQRLVVSCAADVGSSSDSLNLRSLVNPELPCLVFWVMDDCRDFRSMKSFILSKFWLSFFWKANISVNFLVMLLSVSFSFCRQPQVSSLSMPPFGVTLNDSSTQKPTYKWRRVLLKVSGEALAGDQAQNIDPKVGLFCLTCMRISSNSLMLIKLCLFR